MIGWQEKLTLHRPGVDVFFLKENGDMQGDKLSYQFEAICGIAAEPADGLRYYEIDSTGFAVINEPKQFLPLILLVPVIPSS